jgi:hypothetical protein
MYVVNPHLVRTASIASGIALLWYGSAHATLAGLMVMFLGLVALVGGVTRARQPVARSR